MRKADLGFLGVAGALLLAGAIPVIAQRGPESLLPPGFGEQGETGQPEPLLPESPSTPRPAHNGAAPTLPGSTPSLTLDLPGEEELANAAEAAEDLREKYDMPPASRRSLAQIGPLTGATGGVSPQAFGQVRGQFMIGLMRSARAPFVSRWSSILLRRVLLSGIATPHDVNGADLAAERASLLLRMGEADAARMVVQSVDAGNYTPRLYEVAMQTYLATADPAGLCPLLPKAAETSRDARWVMAQAICASFSAEQGTATSFLNQVAHQGRMGGIDYRLAEKAVGAGPSSRRSVKIEWEGVDTLDSWRFGLATATNVEIPAPLYLTAGDQVRAWEARAPMLSLVRRLPAAATAARLGVFSGAALTDYYTQLGTIDDSEGVPTDLVDAFRTAYTGETAATRISAMHAFWTMTPSDGSALGPDGVSYAALPALARAAAALPPTAEAGADMPWLLAAMFAGGYDRNAARWVSVVNDGAGNERAWALLAVGLPDGSAGISGNRIDAFVSADESEGKAASKMLAAALIGLGRLSGDDARALAETLEMRTAPNSRWARELTNAATRREKGTVALLAAIGLQTRSWAFLPPEHLAVILTALRQVGLEPEARMIAAEAITRL
jgi:hypothetical protein